MFQLWVREGSKQREEEEGVRRELKKQYNV